MEEQEWKVCLYCDGRMYRKPNHTQPAWNSKHFCDYLCRTRYRRGIKADGGTYIDLKSPGYGLDDTVMEPPPEVLAEVERRKKEIRDGVLVITST